MQRHQTGGQPSVAPLSGAGFTVVEILVTLTIIAMLVAISVTTFANYAARQQQAAEVTEIERGVAEQRTKAIASLNNSSYGVHVGTSTITFFTGTTYSAGAGSNVPVELEHTVATSSFSHGLPYLSFARVTGTTTATGTIDLFSARTNSTTTITIYGSGLVE